jgi:hypothetical protein
LSSFGDAKHIDVKLHTYAHAKDPGRHEHQTVKDYERFIKEGYHHDGRTKLILTPPETRMPPGWDIKSG